ncbi:MAG: c-type cytochrome domain-containing protein, partial [Desulfohalobiaceae bacterium]
AMTPIIVKMVLATACLGVLIAAAVRQRRDTEKKAPALSLYLLAFVLVVGLGYFGGEIVFGTHQAKVEAGVNATGQEEAKQEKASFARVKPILENRCRSCHSGSNPPHGLRLTSYKELISGTEHGPIVPKGEPGESELYARITGQSEPRMPFRQSPLSDEQIRVIKEWIAAGASGPQ